MYRLAELLLVLAVASAAQTAPPAGPGTDLANPIEQQQSASHRSEGLSREQADAILLELKAIHQLLSAQQNLAATRPLQPSPPAPGKVRMKLAPGWYSMGRDDAPVTLVEFTDYQCPFCRKYHTETFLSLQKNYIETGMVRYISRDLPLDFHPYAQKAAEAARCAGDQKKYWELRDRIISNSAELSEETILKMAQDDLSDMPAFRACLNAEKHKGEIQKDALDASALGISGTPSFVIGKTAVDTLDGDLVVGAVPIAVFDSEIKKFLRSTPDTAAPEGFIQPGEWGRGGKNL
jgi:protein-disulfide isomerase